MRRFNIGVARNVAEILMLFVLETMTPRRTILRFHLTPPLVQRTTQPHAYQRSNERCSFEDCLVLLRFDAGIVWLPRDPEKGESSDGDPRQKEQMIAIC